MKQIIKASRIQKNKIKSKISYFKRRILNNKQKKIKNQIMMIKMEFNKKVSSNSRSRKRRYRRKKRKFKEKKSNNRKNKTI